jgi:hypothetical protein
MTSVSGETADYETLLLKAESAAVRADLFTEGISHDFIWNKYWLYLLKVLHTYKADKIQLCPIVDFLGHLDAMLFFEM